MFAGCASGKGLIGSIFGIKAADTIKVADTVKGADNATAFDNSKKTDTRAGRDITNDSTLMTAYIDALKDNSRQQGKLYRYVIGGLLAQLGVLIGLLGWIIKFQMKNREREHSKDDEFKEGLIQDRRKKDKGAKNEEVSS
jgi:hypothetical protein